MKDKQRIAVVGAGISGLASAWLLGRQHEVTLFEAGNYLGGHTNTVDVHARRQDASGRYRLPRLQREDLPEPDRAVRAARRRQRRDRNVLRGQPGKPRPRMVGQQSGHRLRAEAQSRAPAVLGHALRHPALQPRERRLAGAASRQPAQPARLPGRRPLFARLFRLVPAADGRRDLVLPDRPDARHAARHLRPLLPEPRPAAGFRPAAVAHGEGRRPRIRAQDRRPARRHPPRLPGAARDPRRRRAARDAMPAAASISTRW